MVGLVALGVGCQLMSGLSDLGLGDQATGTACTHSAQCQTEQCVDQVCCEVVCDSPCMGCNQPESEGICAPYAVRTDPDGDCPGMGLCDGSGSCAGGNHTWSLAFGDWNEQGAYAVAVDDNRNIVVVGSFLGDVSFGGDLWHDAGQGDLFVAKFAPNGTPLWSRTYGDSAEQVGTGVAIGSNGEIVVAGRFHGTLNIPGYTLVAADGGSHFLVVLGENGTPQWSRSVPGQYSARVAVDPSSGDVVLAARLTDEAEFGSDTFTPVGPEDMYFARYNEGNLLWATHVVSQEEPLPPEEFVSVLGGLAVDSQGATVFAGGFKTGLDFGDVVLENQSVGSDAYVAKLDENGELVWANRYGGGISQFISGFALHDDDVVIVGTHVGPLQLGSTPLPSDLGRQDIFVGRLSAGGAHLMSRGFSGGGVVDERISYPTAVAVDAAQGNMVITGSLASPINFGGEELRTAGLNDMFFAKLNPAGEHLYSKRYGDVHDQLARAGAIDHQGDVVIAGQFQGTLDFGAPNPLQAAGDFDIFLAKFTP
ncbi:MAG: hypothetical protein JRI68_14120 [Deltaproteobacteria bacterium]|nr:hypothetical protein [Deltaproteobacteria bacterium]